MAAQDVYLATEIGAELLPEPRRILPVELNDREHITVRCHGNPDGPRIFLSHGNGMAADLYYPFWRHFLADCEVLAYDVRNHGWNRSGNPRHHVMANFVFDTECVHEAVEQALGAKPALGMFHSLSSIIAMSHALRVPSRWAGLVLFEPPILPPPVHPLADVFRASQEALGRRTEERQDRYESYAEFEAVLRGSSTFKSLDPECFPLYAAATFGPSSEGDGVVLRCPRDLEARIYVDNADSTLVLALAGLPFPLKILAGDPGGPDGPMPSRICASVFPAYGVEHAWVPGTSHFLQLERPVECARRAREFFVSRGLM